MFQITIGKVVVIEGVQGTDNIYLETDIPEATFPFKALLTLSFSAAKGTGQDYVRKHFGAVEPEVVTVTRSITTFPSR